ncbi:C-C motif chemokine 4 homolog [Odontesthes bonariensis]|uniref:C-C motif chemokine 4 homolog n=1 Tax=Odontesthes bonariensis TaxID=219752 RepID=UPI003F58418E
MGCRAEPPSHQSKKTNGLILLSIHTDSIMKTLCFALGLLLAVFYCDAMPMAVQNTAPGNCCFHFSTAGLPLKRVSSITETHTSCPKKGFVVESKKGKKICYSDTFPWALNLYSRLHSTEGSA